MMLVWYSSSPVTPRTSSSDVITYSYACITDDEMKEIIEKAKEHTKSVIVATVRMNVLANR